MDKPPKNNLKADTLKHLKMQDRVPKDPPRAPPRDERAPVQPPDDILEPPASLWEVQEVSVDDQVYTDPGQNSIARTVVLTSVTYVNTVTGETKTTVVTPTPPAS